MTELEFKSLAAQGYNRIPLIAEAFADLETPLSLYLKLAQQQNGGKNTFLLESVVGGERFGRYSFIGLPASTLLRSYGRRIEVVRDGAVVETAEGNPLDFIAQFQARFRVAILPGMPRFCGGLAGYFGYDTVRHIEKRLADSAPRDDLGLPDIQLLVTEELAVIDNLSGKLYLIVYADPAQPEAYAVAKRRLRELREQLKYSVSAPQVKPSQAHPAERSFAKADYIAAVERESDAAVPARAFAGHLVGPERGPAGEPAAGDRAVRKVPAAEAGRRRGAGGTRRGLLPGRHPGRAPCPPRFRGSRRHPIG